jgi:hypothetical protein
MKTISFFCLPTSPHSRLFIRYLFPGEADIVDAAGSTFASFLVGISPPAMDFRIERGMGIFVYVTASSTWHGEG